MDEFNCLPFLDSASQREDDDPFVNQGDEHNQAGEYLQYVDRLFPGCAWLTVQQIAICLKLSSGHIYNLHSARRLPFKMTKFQSGRLRASVRDIAAYMGDQQTKVRQDKRPQRGARLRWLKTAPYPTDSDTDPKQQKNRG